MRWKSELTFRKKERIEKELSDLVLVNESVLKRILRLFNNEIQMSCQEMNRNHYIVTLNKDP
jgi:hypothetical protein